MRRALVTMGVASMLLGFGADAAGAGTGQPRDEPVGRRLLVVSLPYVTWDHLDRVTLPNINRFVENAAIADLATRGSGRATHLVDGYLTIGSGGRAYGIEVSDGEQLGVDERFGDTTAGAAFETRTGRHVDEGIVSLGIVAIREANRETDFRRAAALALVGQEGTLGLVAVALVDASRPAAEQSHLGRLIDRVQDNGIGDLLVVIGRKLGANLRTFRTSALGIVLPVALVFLVWVDRRQRERVDRVIRDVPAWKGACAGFAVVAVLGWVLNDSGIAVPGVMLSIFIASFVWLLARTDVDAPRAVEEPAHA